MFKYFTSTVKNQIIEGLKSYWAGHPTYTELSDNIQGKFAFNKTRPDIGIIVRNSGGQKQDLSANNCKGTRHSYVFLTKVPHKPSKSIEGILEDATKIYKGSFPQAPGVYYLDIQANDAGEFFFYVDTLLDKTEAITNQLSYVPQANSLRLIERPSNEILSPETDYTWDGGTGIQLHFEPNPNGRIDAIYRYAGDTLGPFPVKDKDVNSSALPGITIVFGALIKGDQCAIVVTPQREPSDEEYGGRWSLSLELDIITRDIYAQQDILDQTVLWLWGIYRPQLATAGMALTDISLGGESEEAYDETGDQYYFNASISLTVETEWTILVPIPTRLLGYRYTETLGLVPATSLPTYSFIR